MIEKDQLIKLSITGLGSSGEGIGTFEGLKVFVEGALPGETTLTKVTERKSTYAKGELLQLYQPSSLRASPPCRYFDRCGGCQLMHLKYDGQLEMKTLRVKETLKRIGGFESLKVENCLPSPLQLGYRNKIQLPLAWDSQGICLGLYEKGTHRIIPVDRCLIHCEKGEEVFQSIQKLIRESGLQPYNESQNNGILRHLLIKTAVYAEKVLVVLVTTGKEPRQVQKLAENIMKSHPAIAGVVENINDRSGNTILGPHYRTLMGVPSLFEEVCGFVFKISPASFFQVNTQQAEILYSTVLKLSDLKGDERLFDLYCGVGTLALIASSSVKEIVGVESVPQAIQDANENAERNKVINHRFICARAESAISSLGHADMVFLNPPRGGCDPVLLAALAKNPPGKIIYISCDPATLARDLAIICKNGYCIDHVQPIDMFPQTMHVETVVRLTRCA